MKLRSKRLETAAELAAEQSWHSEQLTLKYARKGTYQRIMFLVGGRVVTVSYRNYTPVEVTIDHKTGTIKTYKEL